MRTMLLIARQEIGVALRNRWVLAVVLLLAGLALAVAFLGSAPTGQVGIDRLSVTVVSLANLGIFLVPLIALLLSFDAVAGEAERGTLLLLLAHPVARWQVVAGKFLGHLAVLVVATLVGYGGATAAAVLVQGAGGGAAWGAFALLLASTVLLGGVFLGLGLLASVRVRERQTAAGVALGIWLVAVVLFDLALMGALVATGGEGLSAGLVTGIMMLNPADVYRLLNLTAFKDVSVAAGMAGVVPAGTAGPPLLVAVLLLWTALPVAAAWLGFRRREP